MCRWGLTDLITAGGISHCAIRQEDEERSDGIPSYGEKLYICTINLVDAPASPPPASCVTQSCDTLLFPDNYHESSARLRGELQLGLAHESGSFSLAWRAETTQIHLRMRCSPTTVATTTKADTIMAGHLLPVAEAKRALKGYAALAQFMDLSSELGVIRRFGALHYRNLLYYQDELTELEEKLRERDRMDGEHGCRRRDCDKVRAGLMQQVREKLRQYGELTFHLAIHSC